MATPNPNANVVVLNVGGTKFTTTKTTLCGFTVNFFSAMFGGNFTPQPLDDGSFFIDRNGVYITHISLLLCKQLTVSIGDYFHYILEYLRDKDIALPTSQKELLGLYKEVW